MAERSHSHSYPHSRPRSPLRDDRACKKPNTYTDWTRPQVPASSCGKPLVFFLLDIREIRKWNTSSFLRVWGVAPNGNSIQLDLLEYTNSITIRVPDGDGHSASQSSLSAIRRALEAGVEKQMMWKKGYRKGAPHIDRVDIVHGRSIMGYWPDAQAYYRIHFGNTWRTRDALEQALRTGVNANGTRLVCNNDSGIYDWLDMVMQFLVETGIRCASWLEVAADRIEYTTSDAETYAQLSAKCRWQCVKPVDENVDDHLGIPPLRFLSFDIECQGSRKDEQGRSIFPTPEHDPVVTIGNQVYLTNREQPIASVVFQLRECTDANIDGVVRWFNTEAEMLEAWNAFVNQVDPDFLESYNGTQFDLPYLIQRCAKLGVDQTYSRDRTVARVYEARGGTKTTATRKQWKVDVHGRVNWDVYKIVIADIGLKLRGYSLNCVAQQELGDQKMDMSYMQLNQLQDGSPEDRNLIARYCLKDCVLPHQICLKQLYVGRFIELARETGTPLEWLIHRGQAVKASLQIRRFAREELYFVPHRKADGDKYEGALVFDPNRGLYTNPVSTLDFRSLYPNIIRAHNLDYTTWIPGDRIASMSPKDYRLSPRNHAFVTPAVRVGILPRILARLLDARDVAKKAMGAETDPSRKEVLNSRQLALKVSANAGISFHRRGGVVL